MKVNLNVSLLMRSRMKLNSNLIFENINQNRIQFTPLIGNFNLKLIFFDDFFKNI